METPKVSIQLKQCAGKPYQPSNGTEGMMFTSAFCDRCIHDKYGHTGNTNDEMCDIIASTMALDIKDEHYPKEWIYNEEGWPVCTKWQKWDWGNGDDEDGWNDPPEPEPYNPNQLCFPWALDEILEQEPTAGLIPEPVLNL